VASGTLPAKKVLDWLGLTEYNLGGFAGRWLGSGQEQQVVSPVDGQALASVVNVTREELETILSNCHRAFRDWRLVPAPVRGEVVKELGQELRKEKDALAELVTLEMGKALREGLGEVQEMIDICDFAVGLSR
jgi:aldehyde dehydrogenase (NAD+)